MSQATSCRVCSKKRRRRRRRRATNTLEVAATNKPTTISTPTCSSFVRRLLSPESTISSSSLWRRYFTSSPLHNRVISKPQNETAVASRDHETIYRRSIRSNQTKRSVRIISDENFVLLVTNTTIENQEMFEMFENFLSLDATSSFCGDPDYEDFKREFVFAEWPNNNNNNRVKNQINQSTKANIDDQYSCNSNCNNNNNSNKENRQQLVGRNSNIPIQERDGNRNNKSSRRSALMDINNNASIRSSSNNTNIINNNVSMSDLVVVKKNKMKNSKKRNTNTNTIKTTSSTYCSSVDADEEGYEGLVEYNYKSSINNNNNYNYNYNYNCNRNYNSNNNNNVSYLNNNSIRSSENNKNNDNNELRRIIPSLIGWSNKIKTKQILKKSYILLGELELKSIEIGRLNFFFFFCIIILLQLQLLQYIDY